MQSQYTVGNEKQGINLTQQSTNSYNAAQKSRITINLEDAIVGEQKVTCIREVRQIFHILIGNKK